MNDIQMITFLEVLFLLTQVYSSMIATPQNTAVIVGNGVEMVCKTGSGSELLRWSVLPSGSGRTVTLFLLGGTSSISTNVSTLNIDTVHNRSDVLFSDSAQLSDAGIYTCTVSTVGGNQLQYDAHLIVFKTPPLCATNLGHTEDQVFSTINQIWLQCSFNFRGNWTPTLEWTEKRHSEDVGRILGLEDGVKTETILNLSVTSTLTVNPDSVKSTTVYSCKIFFKWSNESSETVANNIPKYSQLWNSPPIIRLSNSSNSTNVTNESSVPMWYFNSGLISVAVSLPFILFAVIAIAYCIRRKRTNSGVQHFSGKRKQESIQRAHTTVTIRLTKRAAMISSKDIQN